MADDVNDKTIALAITTERVTTHVLYDALKQLLISQRRNKKQHNKPKMLSKGKHTMKEMKKEKRVQKKNKRKRVVCDIDTSNAFASILCFR